MGILDRPEDLNLDLEDETTSAHLAEGNDPEEENYEYQIDNEEIKENDLKGIDNGEVKDDDI